MCRVMRTSSLHTVYWPYLNNSPISAHTKPACSWWQQGNLLALIKAPLNKRILMLTLGFINAYCRPPEKKSLCYAEYSDFGLYFQNHHMILLKEWIIQKLRCVVERNLFGASSWSILLFSVLFLSFAWFIFREKIMQLQMLEPKLMQWLVWKSPVIQ